MMQSRHSALRDKLSSIALIVGGAIAMLILVWLVYTVNLLNQEIKNLSEQYLDNHPWHLSQLQTELERLRFELTALSQNNTATTQEDAGVMIELVWNRLDVLIQGNIFEIAKTRQTDVLDFLQDILTTFKHYESSLYDLSDTDVALLLEKTNSWTKQYRAKVVDIFGLSYFRYEEMSQNVISTYFQIRLQLISLVIAILLMSGLLIFTSLRGRRKAIEAQQASLAKSEFLANMSHELRTPLNGIIGTIQIMQQDSALEDEWLDTLSASSEALLAQINDVLDFSRIENGEVLMESIPFDLNLLMLQIVSVIQPMADNKNIPLKIDFPEDWNKGCWVLGDSTKLRQVLLNLLSNAVKFTHAGHVSFRAHQHSSTEFEWQISDTGIGIAEDRKVAIFQPFQQAESTTNRTFGGTGLGLAISQRLTQLMGGQLVLRSNVGDGTVFTFSISLMPLHDPVRSKSQHADPSLRQSHEGHVLLVEDNPVNQKVASVMLKKLGFTVDLANNGAEGLHHFMQRPYQIVFMDIQMPEMDGFECAEKIRSHDSHTPIIALTANSSEDIRSRALAVGMTDFVSKPFRFDHLSERIDRVLRQKK